MLYYNGDGVRLKKACTADTNTQYIPDGMYSVVERTSGGRLRYKYVYGNGMLLARIDSSGTTRYYSHDALGSITGITDASSVYKSYLYDEFGTTLGQWGTGDSKYRYTGQEWEAGPTNAYNLRAREYYPYLGRFMQNDPIGDKGGNINWYSYVANNPVNWSDPIGLLVSNECKDYRKIKFYPEPIDNTCPYTTPANDPYWQCEKQWGPCMLNCLFGPFSVVPGVAVNQYMQSQATNYAMKKGLCYPNRSSTYRSMSGRGSKATIVTALANIAVCEWICNIEMINCINKIK